MHTDFPLRLWDQTLPHAELALNMLQGSQMNPKLSAYKQINGRFDFNQTLLAPPGIKVLHERPFSKASGHPMPKKAGTLDQQWTPIDATKST